MANDKLIEQHSAEDGDVYAQYLLATKFATGEGTSIDPSLALYWYSRSALQGYTHALWNLGTMLVNGEGINKKYINEGMNLIKMAANNNEPNACSFLAHCFQKGLLGEKKSLTRYNKYIDKSMALENFREFVDEDEIRKFDVTLFNKISDLKPM